MPTQAPRLSREVSQRRIARQAAASPLVDLWNALLPLRSVSSFMMTGAHPDDEASGLLARLVKGDGARVIYVSATRGQGGQNALGPESGEALGAIRSREMEEAARVLDAEVHWLDRGERGPLTDFGFAKTAEAATAVWGEEYLLERLVQTIRTVRPDVICPTFLDVPGQHGHHRAVTQATLRAFDLAADPWVFPAQIAAGLAPWRIAKLYLPAFSGAGDAYDDAEPPPPATLSVDIGGFDRVLGATYAQIGEWSRACHRTQGMGAWRPETAAATVPLRLLESRISLPGGETSVFDGLPRRLSDLAGNPYSPVADALRWADSAIESVLASFPDFDGVAASVHAAIAAIDDVEARLDPPHPGAADDIRYRLALKRRQLARASRRALSLVTRLELPDRVVLGMPAAARVSIFAGGPPVSAAVVAVTEDGSVAEPDDKGAIAFMPPAPVPFHASFDPLSPRAPIAARLRYVVDEVEVEQTILPEEMPLMVPALTLDPKPEKLIVRSGTAAPLRFNVTARNQGDRPVGARLHIKGSSAPAQSLDLDAGESRVVDFSIPALTKGRHCLAVAADGIAHGRVRSYDHDHIGRTGWIEPAEIQVLVADVTTPAGIRVGYVDGGGDHVGSWLRQLGVEVTFLDAERLAQGDLQRFATIVVGTKAFGTRPDLFAARHRLHDFVRQGGHLVTQYHRSIDGWDPASTPPARLEIGHPSVRWRVCDPAAPVTIAVPDHPLLTYPNRIGTDDWTGWSRERGLYFASSWDDIYVPLLALSDAGEAPLTGGLLSAEIGLGRHTHVALALAHQMEALVPGAFRLFANLLQPAASR